jgi:hypothetical protein
MAISPKAKKILTCPTCAAAYAVLKAARVPSGTAAKVAYGSKVRKADSGIRKGVTAVRGARKAQKQKESVRKQAKRQSRALQAANAKARKKNGQFRAGWDQARLMRYAHMLRKKEEKKK